MRKLFHFGISEKAQDGIIAKFYRRVRNCIVDHITVGRWKEIVAIFRDYEKIIA